MAHIAFIFILFRFFLLITTIVPFYVVLFSLKSLLGLASERDREKSSELTCIYVKRFLCIRINIEQWRRRWWTNEYFIYFHETRRLTHLPIRSLNSALFFFARLLFLSFSLMLQTRVLAYQKFIINSIFSFFLCQRARIFSRMSMYTLSTKAKNSSFAFYSIRYISLDSLNKFGESQSSIYYLLASLTLQIHQLKRQENRSILFFSFPVNLVFCILYFIFNAW